MLATALPLLLFGANIHYVDVSASGAGNGTSWTDAYTELVPALAVAASGDQVWVAEGTYRPSATGDRSATFFVPGGVALYGGFNGTESTLAERASLFETTILSGDLQQDDGPGFANFSDNSYHVVTLGIIVATVDGFSIASGNATNDHGGGLYAPLLGATTIANCAFRMNRTDHRGGALYLAPGDGALVRNCVFQGNHAEQEGGAVYMPSIDIPPRFESCRFLGNSSDTGGGAIGNGWADIVNCEFSGNSADGASAGGGAIYGGGLHLLNCTLSRNTALGSVHGGGGILTAGYVTLANSILWGNVDDDGSGQASQVRAPLFQVQSSCIQGWTGETGFGGAILFGDPRFTDADGADGVAGTIDDDLRLELGSSCVDTAGHPPGNLRLPLEDVAGHRRCKDSLDCDQGGVLDIGAHERTTVDGTTNYCEQAPTSLGVPAVIAVPCVVSVGSGNLHLLVGPVNSRAGFFFYGSESASKPFGGDTLCIAGETHRLPTAERQDGFLVLDLDLAHPQAIPMVVGSTWHFQARFRDAGILRLSDAVTITFRD